MAGDYIDLRAWQESACLAAVAMRTARRLNGPGAGVVTMQVIRAALSVPANIAEGHGRGLSKDCLRFWKIARGSAAEVESHLRVCALAGYIRSADAEPIIEKARFVRFLVKRLIDSVERRSTTSPHHHITSSPSTSTEPPAA